MSGRGKLASLGRATLLSALLAALVVACTSAPAITPEAAEPVRSVQQPAAAAPLSRAEIMALGSTVKGYSYWWGHGRWDPSSTKYPGKCTGSCGKCSHKALPAGGPEYGADCSGFVAQAWQVPTAGSPKVDRHPYNTSAFRFQKLHWKPIKRSELQAGDALVYSKGGKGHIVLFERWASGGKAVVYECSGCKKGCIHSTRSFGSEYIAIRRNEVDSEQNRRPTGMLEVASCDALGGYASDADAPGQSIDVVLSFDGPATSSRASKLTVKANQQRSQPCTGSGYCNHGFALKLPETLRDGKKHTVYAYAKDPKTGELRLLTGAPRSLVCSGSPPVATGSGTCAHPECTTGGPLAPGCSTCSTNVCIERPSCCQQGGSWDPTCVELAGTISGACRGVCADGQSSCAHSECEKGDALPVGCSTCAASVCKRDAYCCEGGWDWICAKAAAADPYCSCGL